MAKTASIISACLIAAVKAEYRHQQKEEHISSRENDDYVPPQWRTAAIGLGILLAIIAIIKAIKTCLPRLLRSTVAESAEEEPQISIVSSNGLLNGTRKGKGITSSHMHVANEQSDPKHLYLDINLAQTGRKSPSISIEPATPSCECTLEEAQSTGDPSTTEWVASTPPPPPSGTLLWIPSTARRRSVSLRGDSDEENKDQKSVCSSCGGSMSETHTPNPSPPNSETLERKRSVTFNQSVEEIHVLSSETKRPNRSRSPTLSRFILS